jgi:hypothetical protein
LRAGNWDLSFDDEEDSLQDDELDFMIAARLEGLAFSIYSRM